MVILTFHGLNIKEHENRTLGLVNTFILLAIEVLSFVTSGYICALSAKVGEVFSLRTCWL